MVRESELALVRAVVGNQMPLAVGGAFRAAEGHFIEDCFAIGRNGEGPGRSQGGHIIKPERMLFCGLQKDGDQDSQNSKTQYPGG